MSLDLRQASFLSSATALDGMPPDRGREVAFAGRSNAGKSSALNAITGVKGLARASKTPGRTQLINFFGLHHDARLVDLPGYGFAEVPEQVRRSWGEMIQDYLAGRESLAGLVIVMDIRHPLTELDQQLIGWAQPAGIPLHVLLTKADKLSKAQADRAALALRKALGGVVGVTVFSATKGTGKDAARKAVLELLNFPA
jgi:GTP-binding protein